jgi:hypothetical protein
MPSDWSDAKLSTSHTRPSPAQFTAMKAVRDFGVSFVGVGISARPLSPLFHSRGRALACALLPRVCAVPLSRSAMSPCLAARQSSIAKKPRSFSSSSSSSTGLKWTGGRVISFEAEPMEGFYERPTPVLLISGEGYSEKM